MMPQTSNVVVFVILMLTACSHISGQEISENASKEVSLSPSQSVPKAGEGTNKFLDPETLKGVASTMKEKLPEVMDKERIRGLAEKLTGVTSFNKFKIKKLNLDNVPSPLAYHDALIKTAEEYIPKIFPENKLMITGIAMIKSFRENVRDSPETLLE